MAKGSQGERTVAKDLSLWWTRCERDDCVWRTSGSGARFTTRAKSGQHTAYSVGDFTFTDPIAKPLFDLLVIENKVGYSGLIDPLAGVDGKKEDILDKWLKKAKYECQQAHRKYPLVIFKRNHKDRCVLLPFEFFNDIAQKITPTFPRILMYPQRTVIMGFDQFLNWCMPEIIELILRKEKSK